MAISSLILTPLSGIARGVAARPAVSCGPSWTIVPSSAVPKDLRGIAVVSQNDVWVVGTQPAGKAQLHPAAEHWDGSTWSLVGTPFAGLGENALNAVSAVAGDDIWAVGYWQAQKKVDPAFQTLTEHWDGTSWQIVPSPTVPQSGSNTLTGVTAVSGNDVWAVGYYFSSLGVRKTLVEHFDGSSWTIVQSPNPGSASDALLAVTAATSDDVWAVGFASGGFGYDDLILHYDGTSWHRVRGGSDPSSAEDVLAGVSQDGSNDVWAFGYHVIGSDYRTLIEHWDGSSWSVQPSANGSDGVVSILRGGSVHAGDVWAAGFDYHMSDGRYKEYTEHLSGSAWTSVDGALSGTKAKSEMHAIAHVPGTDEVWSSARMAHVELICPGALAGSHRAAGPPSASVGARAGFASRPGHAFAMPGVVRALPRAVAAPNVSIPTAADMAGQAGIFENTRTHGAVAADFNGDGWPDLFVNRHQNPAKLYLNDRDGTFTLVDFGTFAHRDRHGCSAADVNGDGRLDIFCNTGSDRGTEAKEDELWIQEPNGDFVDQAAQYGVLQPFDRGRLSAFLDANRDGMPDVYAANYPDRADGMPSSNRLFVNRGGTAYRLGPQFGLDQEISASTISVGDYNNDGYQDILVAGLGGIQVDRNDAGTGFTDVSAAVGMDHRANAALFVDFNGDGRLDIAEVTDNLLRVDLQQPDGTFEAGPEEPLESGLKLATGDVNGDGMADIYVLRASTGNSANAPDLVFLNNGAGTGFGATPIEVPPPSKLGSAEDVTAIDYDHNGLMDFLVQNGNGNKPGSIQLIAFFPG